MTRMKLWVTGKVVEQDSTKIWTDKFRRYDASCSRDVASNGACSGDQTTQRGGHGHLKSLTKCAFSSLGVADHEDVHQRIEGCLFLVTFKDFGHLSDRLGSATDQITNDVLIVSNREWHLSTDCGEVGIDFARVEKHANNLLPSKPAGQVERGTTGVVVKQCATVFLRNEVSDHFRVALRVTVATDDVEWSHGVKIEDIRLAFVRFDEIANNKQATVGTGPVERCVLKLTPSLGIQVVLCDEAFHDLQMTA